MDLLVLSAFGLVADRFFLRKKMEQRDMVNADDALASSTSAEPPLSTTALSVQQPPSSACLPSLGVRTLKTHATDDAGFDQRRNDEQYAHPEDPNATVSEKPWMRMANAPYKPKEETVSDIPGPQDVFGRDMKARVQRMEADFAGSTVPVTSEKQFDRPVEQISTGNGSAVGFHIGAAPRYHKFLFNQQETIESGGGPRGAFSGASRSHVKGDYRTVTQRSSLAHESVGPPLAVGVPHAEAPPPSFELAPSHMETYRMDDHISKGARAPVQASASTNTLSFAVAHDEDLQVLHTSLVTGGERFATGASGYRGAKIHVPLNNDPLETYDQRVVPNFKIAKASDFQDQKVEIRQKMIPEMSQNVSALRKDRRPPVTGETVHKNQEYAIATEKVLEGSGVRGATSLPISAPKDAFHPPANRKQAVADGVSLVSAGAAAAHLVSATASVLPASSSREFRTTKSMSEAVGTPFIRGSGGRQQSELHAIHEEKDTHLSEMDDSYGLRQGLNKTFSAATAPALHSSERNPSQDEKRSSVFKKSERDPVLVPPGELGTNPTGSVNFDARGMISLRESDSSSRDGNNASSILRVGKVLRQRNAAPATSTKNRKLGAVLQDRVGSSAATKRLLMNPYSRPAASRINAL